VSGKDVASFDHCVVPSKLFVAHAADDVDPHITGLGHARLDARENSIYSPEVVGAHFLEQRDLARHRINVVVHNQILRRNQFVRIGLTELLGQQSVIGKLKSLPNAKDYLKPDTSFEILDSVAHQISDNTAADQLQKARRKLFKTIHGRTLKTG
jgi:hypothetical protein